MIVTTSTKTKAIKEKAYYFYPGEFVHGTNIIIANIIVFLDFTKSSYPGVTTIPTPQNIVHIMTQLTLFAM